jgi:hypothetical protein
MINKQTDNLCTKCIKLESVTEISTVLSGYCQEKRICTRKVGKPYLDISEWKTRLKLQMVETKEETML